MGAGKSKVGESAANKLGVECYDTDAWMENEMGINVAALVKGNLVRFRRKEADALREVLATSKEGIISTGGGIISTAVGRKALLGSGVPVVWLEVPFDVARQRVLSDSGRERPLFADAQKARALFDERQQWYEETASHRVDASQPIGRVVNDVLSAWRLM